MYPYLFRIGSFELRIYSVMIILALLIAMYFISRRSKSLGMNPAKIENSLIVIFLFGVLGARLYYVVFNWNYFSAHPGEIIAIWHGGLAIHGGIIIGVIAAFIYCYINKLSVFKLTDLAAPFLLLGQGIGRFGNFANGEAHGVPTITPPAVIFQAKPDFAGFWKSALEQYNVQDIAPALTGFYQYIKANGPLTVLYQGKEYLLKEYVPWGVSFPARFNSLAYHEFGSMPVHPTFFYEMILNFIGAAVLIKLWRKDENIGSGKIFALYMLFYAFIRGFVTFFRADDLMFGPLRAPHLASILLIVCAALWFAVAKLRLTYRGTRNA